MTKSGTPLSTGKFSFLIVSLGCSFPVAATIIDLWRLGLPLSFANALAIQTSQPLHWIIDSIPLFLVLSRQIFGRATKQLTPSSKPTAYIEQQVTARTAKLTKTITELKDELVVSKRTEETLRAGEEFYRNLIENSNDGIITVSLDGTITSVNRGVEIMLGRPREELIRQHFSTILSTSSSEQAEDRLKRFRNGERLSSVFEAEWLHKNGSIILVEVRTRPVYDKTGTPIGFQSICRDTAKRRHIIDKLFPSQSLSQSVEEGGRIETSLSSSTPAANIFSILEYSQNVSSSHESAQPNKKPSHFALTSEGVPVLEHSVEHSPFSKNDGVTTLTPSSSLVADEVKPATPISQSSSTATPSISHSPTQRSSTLPEQQKVSIPVSHSDSTTNLNRIASSSSRLTSAPERGTPPSSIVQVSLLPDQQKSEEHSPNITFFPEQNTQTNNVASNEILNLSEALNRVDGDKELLSEMTGVFLDEYPRLLAAMHDALSHGNAQTLTYAVHTLKGSVGNFAASGAFEAALRLEKLGRQGNLSQAQGALVELEEQLAYLEPILANLKIEVAA